MFAMKYNASFSAVSAVIVAGGKGTRMGADQPKQFLCLGEEPVLLHAIRQIGSHPVIGQVIVTLPAPAALDQILGLENLSPAVRCKIQVADGGTERQQSVYKGLKAIKQTDGLVLIHDGVRPFLSHQLIDDCLAAAQKYGAASAGCPASDTLKEVDQNFQVLRTMDRSRIWQTQTPQVFHYEIIMQAHVKAIQNGLQGTDDAALAEALGHKVQMVIASRWNLKLTRPEDLFVAEALLAVWQNAVKPR